MMAKMFYTLEETKSALEKSEEEIKQFSREGRLREFRDGPRLMFKADQVEQLRNDLEHGVSRADLGGSDSGAAIGMQDIGASGSGVISLADTDFGKSPGAALLKDDTALASDLGLSGSVGGLPSPGKSGSGSGSGSRGGVTVFDVDDSARPDPSAQTAIGSGMQHQMSLESAGSGSGLLDLTKESDDTSLGAELLDEMGPGASGMGSMGGTGRRPAIGDSGIGSGIGSEQLTGASNARSRVAQPVFVEAKDPLAEAFGWLSLGGSLIVLFGGFVVANAVFGVHPQMVRDIIKDQKEMIFLIGAAVGCVLLFGIGWIIGKATR